LLHLIKMKNPQHKSYGLDYIAKDVDTVAWTSVILLVLSSGLSWARVKTEAAENNTGMLRGWFMQQQRTAFRVDVLRRARRLPET
jgi:hypothetical protein